MKTTIVCGVLGAGKTTFLRNILKNGYERTVVLVNDFGSAGIDGEIISSGGIGTLNIQPVAVVCIVDATEFIDAYETDMYGWFFKSQITQSDIILINKTDLTDQEQTLKKLR